MSTEVERSRGFDREGIEADQVHWNLSNAALYEEAVRRRTSTVRWRRRSSMCCTRIC